MRILTTLVLASLALNAPLFGQGYDIRVAPEEGTRVGISVKKTIGGFRNLKIGDKVQTSDVQVKENIYLADRFAKVEESRLLMERKYVSWARTEGRQVKDPEVTGLVVAYQHDKEAGEHSIEMAGDRKVRPDTLDRLMALSNSIGFNLELPAAAPIARHFEIDFSGVLPLLLDGGGTQTKADFVLESFDTGAREGQLVGSLIAETVADDGVLQMTTLYSGVCRIGVSQKVRRITEFSWEGLVQYSGGSEAIEITGNGDFSIAVKVSVGDGVEEQYRAEPSFRDVERTISQLGVKFSLPSHWYELPREEGATGFTFQSTVTGVKVNLELSNRDANNPASYIAKVEEQLRPRYPAMESSNAKSTVGDGRMVSFHEAGNRFTLGMLANGPKRILQIRVIRSADADDPMNKSAMSAFLGTLAPLL